MGYHNNKSSLLKPNVPESDNPLLSYFIRGHRGIRCFFHNVPSIKTTDSDEEIYENLTFDKLRTNLKRFSKEPDLDPAIIEAISKDTGIFFFQKNLIDVLLKRILEYQKDIDYLTKAKGNSYQQGVNDCKDEIIKLDTLVAKLSKEKKDQVDDLTSQLTKLKTEMKALKLSITAKTKAVDRLKATNKKIEKKYKELKERTTIKSIVPHNDLLGIDRID